MHAPPADVALTGILCSMRPRDAMAQLVHTLGMVLDMVQGKAMHNVLTPLITLAHTAEAIHVLEGRLLR